MIIRAQIPTHHSFANRQSSTGVQYVQVTYALVIAGTEDIDERLVVLFNKDLPFSSLMGQRVLLGVAETPHPRSILYTHHQLEARTGSHS